jgi:hypothetical protein
MALVAAQGFGRVGSKAFAVTAAFYDSTLPTAVIDAVHFLLWHWAMAAIQDVRTSATTGRAAVSAACKHCRASPDTSNQLRYHLGKGTSLVAHAAPQAQCSISNLFTDVHQHIPILVRGVTEQLSHGGQPNTSKGFACHSDARRPIAGMLARCTAVTGISGPLRSKQHSASSTHRMIPARP